MNALLTAMSLLLGVGILMAVPLERSAPALLICVVVAALFGYAIHRTKSDRIFLLRIFVISLITRVALSTVINLGDMHEFFGPDALGYDELGYTLLKVWQGHGYLLESMGFVEASNWGMVYFVAVVYAIIGRNLLAIQFLNSVVGAATVVGIYLCARHIFQNATVARIAAFCVAFFPSLVLWSAQGLKDALVVFLLVMTMLGTLKLAERLSIKFVVMLACALLGVLTLRFYVFYLAVIAIGGTFFVGTQKLTSKALLRQCAIIVVLGLAFAYLGVLGTASRQLATFGSLERVQASRQDQASYNSGYAADIDVSTPLGALSAVPIGMIYLLFAPFPWEVENFRQSITVPEMIAWYCMFPLMVLGLFFTVRHRVRQALPVLLFNAMLTVAYAVYQSNIGAAYRMRAQLLVFYFIFVAVGVVLLKEKNERMQDVAAIEKRRLREMPASVRERLAIRERQRINATLRNTGAGRR